MKKCSRWQAYVWDECVLSPVQKGQFEVLSLRDEQAPNVEQIGRYFPDFARAVAQYRTTKDEAQMCAAAGAVRKALPAPRTHFDLAFLVDHLESMGRLDGVEDEE